MTEERLAAWLRRADESAAPPPVVEPDFAAWARRARARRVAGVQRWAALGAAACIALAVFVAHSSRTPGAPPSGPPAARLAVLAQEAGAMRNEADVRLRVALRVADLLAEGHAASGKATIDPEVDARIELDIAAQTLFRKAERLTEAVGPGRLTASEYQRVVRLFPDTKWAAVARERLARLEPL